ncbi:unnamed protein product [Penicillium salamii]|uniref:GRF-like zinc ribbon domain-containing protein n=1 Tax=Penicillium salamii TaxID=1612424 RepID=A0A9W4IJC4_9EURO|nr:unnamed protein product [Penicillium salamii]
MNTLQVTLSLDLASIRPIRLAPPPDTPPRCTRCDCLGSEKITRTTNRKGNAGRHYYKYLPCDKFLCFIDDRGNDPTNPSCHCEVSSKTYLAGSEKRVPRGLFFACRLGACDFHQPFRNSRGQHITVSSYDLADHLINLRLI